MCTFFATTFLEIAVYTKQHCRISVNKGTNSRLWHFYFFFLFLQNSDLLVETKRKITLHSGIFYRTKCKFRKKGNFFEKKSRVFTSFRRKHFDVNIVRFSYNSHFPKQGFKARKRYLFSFRNVPIKSAKTSFAAERDVLKSAKKGTYLHVKTK